MLNPVELFVRQLYHSSQDIDAPLQQLVRWSQRVLGLVDSVVSHFGPKILGQRSDLHLRSELVWGEISAERVIGLQSYVRVNAKVQRLILHT